jgi:prostaglandin-E synthase
MAFLNFQKSKFAVRERVIEFALEKKEPGFWERLLSEKAKYHWLKTDFNKWKDEDESDDEEGGGGQDIEEVHLDTFASFKT